MSTDSARKWVVRPVGMSLLSQSVRLMPDGPVPGGLPDPIARGGADMEYTMQLVLTPGTHASGVDVSTEPRSWQRKRPGVVTLIDFPSVNGTGVSAGGCRT